MNWLRPRITSLLIAVLVLTGHSMAVSRGMPATSGFMELCTGTGPVMTPMDANGNPTGPSHICPEFSLSLMDVVATSPVMAVPLVARARRVEAPVEASLQLIRLVEASARAPPFLVL